MGGGGFTARASQRAAPTSNAPGRMSPALCKLCQWSDRAPMIWLDQRSPNKWMAKIEMAMALAHRFTGTVSIMSVFTGPVERKSRNTVAARYAMQILAFPVTKVSTATGTAARVEQ